MYLTKSNPHGGDVYGSTPLIDFSASINPMGMPEKVRQAIINSVDRCTSYPDPYCRDLRDAIAGAEGVYAGHILCGAGASELIYQYAWALPGGRPALIVAPAFSEYASAVRAAGKAVEYLVLTPENGFRLTQDILSQDLSGYSAVFLCSPANPTGVTVEPELVRKLAETGVRLFCDFCFLDLTLDPGRYDIPALTAGFPNVSVLRSPTKSFAIPGVRLGYLISSDSALLERMSESGQCWNVSVPAQMAGTAAMGCLEWLRRSAELIASERERLFREISGMGLTVFPGEANYLLLRSGTELKKPLAAMGYAVRDCSDFVGLSRGYIRTAVSTESENGQLLAALKEVLS